MIKRKGITSKTRYQIAPERKWTQKILKIAPVETTGNGVIDAKLRKEANLPATASALENLITAATDLQISISQQKIILNKEDYFVTPGPNFF